jgi:hypothetical protein
MGKKALQEAAERAQQELKELENDYPPPLPTPQETTATQKPSAPTKPHKKPQSDYSPIVPTPTQKQKVLHTSIRLDPAHAEKLPIMCKQASPFTKPLSTSELIDLIYVETMNSTELMQRLQEQDAKIKEYFLTSVRLKSEARPPKIKSNSNVTAEIRDFFMQRWQCSPETAISLFLTWAIMDWQFIRPKITYKGPKQVIN